MAKNFGFSFSLNRALGISSTKAKLSRQIGIPLTKQGRQRKFAKTMGCITFISLLFSVFFFCTILFLLF